MIAFYDHKPPRLEAVGNGNWYYRWDVEKAEKPRFDIHNEEPSEEELDEVIVRDAVEVAEIDIPAEDVDLGQEEILSEDSIEEEHGLWKCQEVVFAPPMTSYHVSKVVANELGVEEESEEWNETYLEVASVVVPYDLDAAKKELEEKIWAYDKQTEEFFIGGVSVWLNREERQTILRRCDAEEAKGLDRVVLRKNGMKFELPIATCRAIVLDVEFYASRCWDNREDLLVAKDELTTAEEILSFDVSSGYPEKLSF